MLLRILAEIRGISSEELKDYVLEIEAENNLAASTIEIHIHALKFLINVALNRKSDPFIVDRRKRERPLPVVLSREELKHAFDQSENVKHRTLFLTAYGTGLRIEELCNLQVGDIDSKRMVIHVRMEKGRKDRYTLLTPELLRQLRAYWLKYRPTGYLFTGPLVIFQLRPTWSTTLGSAPTQGPAWRKKSASTRFGTVSPAKGSQGGLERISFRGILTHAQATEPRDQEEEY